MITSMPSAATLGVDGFARPMPPAVSCAPISYRNQSGKPNSLKPSTACCMPMSFVTPDITNTAARSQPSMRTAMRGV